MKAIKINSLSSTIQFAFRTVMLLMFFLTIYGKALAQNDSTILLVEQQKSNKQLVLTVGQTVGYKTLASTYYEKGRITGFTDSTISFKNKRLGYITIRHKDLAGLKAQSPWKKIGGTMLIMAGAAGVAVGVFFESFSESNTGSGESDHAAVALIVGGAAALVTGIVLVQPKIVHGATLRTSTKAITRAATVQKDYRKFKVGIGLDYGHVMSGKDAGGLGFYLEPMYRIKDKIAIGVKFESAPMTPQSVLPSITTPGTTIHSFSLNAQYYFSNNKFRPFIGAGIGSYSPPYSTYGAGDTMGFYPRVGFDFEHFNLTLDYNILPTQSVIVGTETFENKYTYFGIKMGISLGGGKK